MAKRMLLALVVVVLLMVSFAPVAKAAGGGESDELVKTLQSVEAGLKKAGAAIDRVAARACAGQFKKLAVGQIEVGDLSVSCAPTQIGGTKPAALALCIMQVDARKGALRRPFLWKEGAIEALCEWAVE